MQRESQAQSLVTDWHRGLLLAAVKPGWKLPVGRTTKAAAQQLPPWLMDLVLTRANFVPEITSSPSSWATQACITCPAFSCLLLKDRGKALAPKPGAGPWSLLISHLGRAWISSAHWWDKWLTTASFFSWVPVSLWEHIYHPELPCAWQSFLRSQQLHSEMLLTSVSASSRDEAALCLLRLGDKPRLGPQCAKHLPSLSSKEKRNTGAGWMTQGERCQQCPCGRFMCINREQPVLHSKSPVSFQHFVSGLESTPTNGSTEANLVTCSDNLCRIRQWEPWPFLLPSDYLRMPFPLIFTVGFALHFLLGFLCLDRVLSLAIFSLPFF